MTGDEFIVPRCAHGNIILGCPHDDCKEQNEYLADFRRRLKEYEDAKQAEARKLVRDFFGLPT